MTYMFILKCALKLVEEIILCYYIVRYHVFIFIVLLSYFNSAIVYFSPSFMLIFCVT